MPTTPARTLTRAILSACLLPLALGSGGCLPDTQPVQVRLNNQAPHAIAASIVHSRGSATQTLVRRTIRANQTDTLGPIPRPSGGSLNLVLEHAEQFDATLRTPLASGLTSYRVVQPTFSAKGPLELRPETAEQEWTELRGYIPSSRRDPDRE
ncbi:MAG: hypothetical protein ACF8Q5_10535 [Phycisphaerales bacterium JB040]